jgi:WhiB family transcriptional regulator, redox-sensing transcriptional regulator
VTELRGRDWRQLAACARPGVDPELFFPNATDIGKTRQAKQICAGCAVKAPCLADALARPETADHGIYGGTTPRQRGQIRKEAQRGSRLRPSLMTDPALAAEAFELARRIGTDRAAEQLGVTRWRLYHAWDQWHLGRPNWRGRSLTPSHVLDPLAAQRAFQLAERLGLDLGEVAHRLGINPSLLGDAWERWGLGRPGASAKAARGRAEPQAGDPTRHRQRPARHDVAEPATTRTARARSGLDQERER